MWDAGYGFCSYAYLLVIRGMVDVIPSCPLAMAVEAGVSDMGIGRDYGILICGWWTGQSLSRRSQYRYLY